MGTCLWREHFVSLLLSAEEHSIIPWFVAKAGGAFEFVVVCVAGYHFVALMFESVDMPFKLPVGDLSNVLTKKSKLSWSQWSQYVHRVLTVTQSFQSADFEIWRLIGVLGVRCEVTSFFRLTTSATPTRPHTLTFDCTFMEIQYSFSLPSSSLWSCQYVSRSTIHSH